MLNFLNQTCKGGRRTVPRMDCHRQARHQRHGSVLILVVALLVLLAIIGTAFLTTTGADRDAAVQHRYNVQVDLLVEGVEEMAKAQLLAGIVQPAGFRPPQIPLQPIAMNPAVLPPVFANVDWAPWDTFLADRYPVREGGSTGPMWKWISASPLANADPTNPIVSQGPPQFSSPYVNTTAKILPALSSRMGLVPTKITINSPTGVPRDYPAFRITQDPTTPSNVGSFILAGDADGDGIADSGLFELPIGQIDGVKYYGSMRIVDNCAAINASVAWENSINTAVAPNASPVNVELKRLLQNNENGISGGNNFDGAIGFNAFRCGNTYNAVNLGPSLKPVRDPYLVPSRPARLDTFSPSTALHFEFWNPYDALWTMLGSRLDSPGYNYDESVATVSAFRYRSLGNGESAGLAYRYCLANQIGPQTALERYFPASTRSNTINRPPFQPGDAPTWFTNILDYEGFAVGMKANPPTNPPLRPLVVGSNPVSNFSPAYTAAPVNGGQVGPFVSRGDFKVNNSYLPGDWVVFTFKRNATDPAQITRAFVCIEPNIGDLTTTVPYFSGVSRGTLPPYSPNFKYWAEVPWLYHPVKMNVNTASFGQLFAAYNAVMADAPEVVPQNAAADGGYGAVANGAAPGGSNPPIFTFGNSARLNTGPDVNQPTLTPPMMKRLRAAIAAVNTIDLRDSDDDVTSRTVFLGAGSGGRVTAQVYGTERQPYISEAFVELTKEGQNFVVLELFNPYAKPIDLNAYYLAYRAAGAAPTLLKALNGRTIPAHGYLYLQSAADDPIIEPTKRIRVPGTADVVPELEQLVRGGVNELLLLRTRRENGMPMTSTDPANTFNEGAAGSPNLLDLVPADQLDFAGIAQGVNVILSGADTFMVTDRYHYRRATSIKGDGGTTSTDNPWHCVYGGPYRRGTVASQERRQRGFIRNKRPDDMKKPENEFMYLSEPGFGNKQPRLDDKDPNLHNDFVDDGSLKYYATFRTRPLQVNGPGMPGPNKPLPDPAATTPAKAPYGGFVRAGDILAVTFTGSYHLPELVEFNSVSADSAFAEDGDFTDDTEQGAQIPLEQLGRFCPIRGKTSAGAFVDDAAGPVLRYQWANDLFDYLTVICPQDDYMANVDQQQVPKIGTDTSDLSGDPTLPRDPEASRSAAAISAFNNQPKWRIGIDPNKAARETDLPPSGYPFPQAITNLASGLDPTTANGGQEDTAPIHGLININTANLPVLASLPFTSPTDRSKNFDIASTIIAWREANGPFRNLFDLQKLELFRTNSGALANAVGLAGGDLSPDSVSPGDFESRYMMMTRISNMVTFRSDSFTVYVQVQGWRGAGSSAPELVVQRRAAMLVNRASVRPIPPAATAAPGTPGTLTPMSTTNVPNN